MPPRHTDDTGLSTGFAPRHDLVPLRSAPRSNWGRCYTPQSAPVTLFAVFSPVLAAGAAVAAVGVPLLIHLLFRKRYQIVPWAAVRFLFVAERRHRRRIDQWLLLALRALALILPLLAMIAATKWAEPLWQAIKPGTTETIANIPRTHHVIVLDASLSMTARADDGQSRFDKAVSQAENMIRSGSPGDGYTLIVLAGSVQPIVPGPANDPERVVAELRKVKPTHGAAETAAALATVADVIARSPRRLSAQATNVLHRPAAFGLESARSSSRTPHSRRRYGRESIDRADVVVVDVANSDLENRAVAEVSLTDQLPMIETPASVKATIANLGRSEKRNVRVQLLLGRPSVGIGDTGSGRGLVDRHDPARQPRHCHLRAGSAHPVPREGASRLPGEADGGGRPPSRRCALPGRPGSRRTPHGPG